MEADNRERAIRAAKQAIALATELNAETMAVLRAMRAEGLSQEERIATLVKAWEASELFKLSMAFATLLDQFVEAEELAK